MALAKLGWTTCYVKITRHYHQDGWHRNLPGWLMRYRRLVIDAHAPAGATFRGLEVASEANLIGHELVHEDHQDPQWRSSVADSVEAAERAARERRAERQRKRYWDLKEVPAPPRR